MADAMSKTMIIIADHRARPAWHYPPDGHRCLPEKWANIEGLHYKSALLGGRLDVGEGGTRVFGALWVVACGVRHRRRRFASRVGLVAAPR